MLTIVLGAKTVPHAVGAGDKAANVAQNPESLFNKTDLAICGKY